MCDFVTSGDYLVAFMAGAASGMIGSWVILSIVFPSFLARLREYLRQDHTLS
jgi:hypothetical protein